MIRDFVGARPGLTNLDLPRSVMLPAAGVPREDPPPAAVVWPEAKRVRELTERRTANTRFFQLSDGRVQAEVSPIPSAYRAPEGSFEPIDTHVRTTGADGQEGFVAGNTTNTFTSLFGGRSDRLVRFEQANRFVELGLAGAPAAVEPTVDGSTVTYPGLADGGDVVYEVTATALKEKLVLHQPPSGPVSYTFTLHTGGLVARPQADGSIAFTPRDSSDSSQAVFVMPPPLMYDSRDDASTPVGKVSNTSGITQRLSQMYGQTTITLSADARWLADPARVYPVVLDPTVRVQPVPTDGQDVQIYSGTPTTNLNDTYQLKVGTDTSQSWRSLVRFPLTGVPAGTVLDDARLELFYDQTHTAWEHDVAMEARRVTAPWTESTATWANMNANIAAQPAGNVVMVDDGDPGTSVVGSWPWSANTALTPLAINADYRVNNDTTAGHTHTWVPTITESGDYQVEVHHVSESDRATNATYTVNYAGGSRTYTVDQTGSPLGVWKTLGVHPFVAGTSGRIVLSDVAGKAVIADAIRLTRWGVTTKKKAISSVWSSFPVRNVVQEWVNGTQPNHGFMVKAVDEAVKGRGGPIFEASEFAYQSGARDYNLPRLIMTWGRPGVTLSPPTTVTATGALLDWTAYTDPSPAPGDNIVEYQVHRSVFQTFTPTPATLIAPLPPTQLSYQDTTGRPTPANTPDTQLGQLYYYMIAVKTADGQIIAAPTQSARLPKAGQIKRIYRTGTLDTTLSQTLPSTNVDVYDGDPYVSAGNNSSLYGVTRGLVKYAALTGTPANAQLVSAQLRMWTTTLIPGTTTGDVIDVHRLTRDFTETQATWNRANTTTAWTAPGGDFDPVPMDGQTGLTNDPEWQSWDIRPAVNTWLANPTTNFGLLLKMHNETTPAERIMLLASEAAEPMLKPTLEVTYLEPSTTSTYHAPDTPAAMAPAATTTVPVTLSNPTTTTWTAAGWELSYHWLLPDGTEITNSGNQIPTALPEDISPGETVDVTAQVKAPAPSADGNKRTDYQLGWELRNKTTGQWLSNTSGITPLEQRTAVEEPTSDQLGLEKFYQYAGEDTGAGGSLMSNLYAGNTVWSYDAFTNPSRGISTFMRIAYNSLDTSDTVAGYGWSLQASSLMRLGTPLDFHPNPHPTTVKLTDGDGTTHTFTWNAAANEWQHPAGVHLFLQQLVDCQPQTEEAQAWVITRPDRTQFFYDCDGYISSIVDRNSNTMTFTYEVRRSQNKPTKFLRYITDATGRQTITLTYWAKGDTYDLINDTTWTKTTGLVNLTNPKIIDHVRSITDVSARKLAFTYTDKGLLGELIDGDRSSQPKVFKFQYDMTQGNKNVKLVKTIDPRGNATTIAYYDLPGDDPKFHWNTKSYTDRLNNTTTFAYTDPDGPTGNTISTVVTDAENHATSHVMDGFGRPTQMTNAKNQTTKLAWDADHNVSRLEEANGAVTTSVYDARTGYPIEIKDAEAVMNGWPGTTLAYQFGLNGHFADLIAKQSSEGRRWTLAYDTLGNLTGVTDPLGNTTPTVGDYTTTYAYDAFGQITRETDANGHATGYADFDPNGYPQTITDALTNATTFTYDVRGNVTKIVDALGHDMTQTYDAFARPLERKAPRDASAATPVYIVHPAPVYDANDNVVTSTAANGAVTTNSYDAVDQLAYALAPVDVAGDPERRTSYTYDKVGNLKTTTEPKGNLTTTAGDFVTTNNYNEISQLISVVDASGHTTSYEYDNVGNVVTMADPRKNTTADTADFTAKYAYDRDHRTVKTTDALGKFITTAYDRDGLAVSTTDQLNNTTLSILDARGMVAEERAPQKVVNGAMVYHVTKYEYDQVGNRTRVISPRGVATTDDPDDFATTTVYDELNRTKETLTPYDRDDARYTTPDRTIYSYDAVGRLTKVSAPPSFGETTRNDNKYTYWDDGLTRTSTDPWNIVTSYVYDVLGQQTLRTVTSAGGSSSRTMSWQYYPDGKLKARADDGVPVGLQVVLVDNSDFNNTTTTGTWTKSASAPDQYGTDYQTHPAGTSTDTFTWQLNIPQDGSYEVFVQYPSVSGAATDAKFTVGHNAGNTVKTVNETAGAGTWVSLGFFTFTAGNAHKVSLSGQATGIVVADAFKLVRNNAGETDTEKYDYTNQYDANGKMTAITDASAAARVDTYDITYTGLNQVDTIKEMKAGAVKNTTSYTYDENGAVLTTQHDKQYAAYTYDARNLVATVLNGATAADPTATLTTFGYTDRGERQRQVRASGNKVDYTYQPDGLLSTQRETKADDTLVADHAIEYDLNRNRTRDVTKKMNADNHSAYLNTTYDYAYDPRDRVRDVTKTGDGAAVENYIHDANNNVIEQTVNNQRTTYSYDRNRLMTANTQGVTLSYNYDPFGRTDFVSSASSVIQRFVYDGFDHVVEDRQISGTQTSVTRHTYDPMDRTTSTTTDADTATQKTTVFNYLGLGAEVLDEEVDGAVKVSYQYTPTGERLSQLRRNTNGTTEIGYYGYNAHADVEQVSESSGNTRATYGYTAYGSNDDLQFTGADKPDAADPAKEPYNSYRYNNKRADPGSGMYDMGFRDYDPELNRFLTRDTYNGALNDMRLGLDPWTGNRYAFGGGNPISSVEYDGHCSINPFSWGDCVDKAIDSAGDAWNEFTDWAGQNWDEFKDWAEETKDAIVDEVVYIKDWVVDHAEEISHVVRDTLEIALGVMLIDAGIGMFGGGLVIDLGIVTIPIGIAVDAAAVGVIVIGGGLAGDGAINLGKDLNTMFAKKTSRRTPKERASDMPSWARGNKKKPGESTEDAIKRIYEENGKELPPKGDRGAGSDYSKIKKGLERGGR